MRGKVGTGLQRWLLLLQGSFSHVLNHLHVLEHRDEPQEPHHLFTFQLFEKVPRKSIKRERMLKHLDNVFFLILIQFGGFKESPIVVRRTYQCVY